MPGVGNFVTKKLLEKRCVAQCQIAPLCSIKWNAILYNTDLSVKKKKSGSYLTASGHWAAIIRNGNLTSIIRVHHAVCSPQADISYWACAIDRWATGLSSSLSYHVPSKLLAATFDLSQVIWPPALFISQWYQRAILVYILHFTSNSWLSLSVLPSAFLTPR